MKNKNLAFNYFGGKYYYVDQIIQFLPDHTHFLDLFCGSMTVILNKPFSRIDTANDINGNVVNFFRVLRTMPEELIRVLKLTPVARDEYNSCWPMETGDELERARRFYTRVRQSFFGLGAQRQNKGWHLVKLNSRNGYSELISKWHNGIESLGPVIEKLQRIQIENKDFRELVPVLDFEGLFIYADPPYHFSGRNTSEGDYMNEFTNQDHEELAEMLHYIKGKAMISGYDTPEMQKLYADWTLVKFAPKRTNIASTDKQECIWMNYELQNKLF